MATPTIEGLRVEAVASPRGREFLETYGALAAEFGPRGELERREVVERWIEGRLLVAAPFQHTYRLLALRDARGALIGVRDVHVVLDPATRIVVAYLAHALVLPPYRRHGAGAMLRAAPVAFARRAAHDAHLGDAARIFLAAEMEPPKDDDSDSIVRLVAYGRSGFSAMPSIPYFQPDFSDPRARPGEGAPHPLRLLPVVRQVDVEQGPTIDADLARAFVRHLYAVFATHVARSELVPLEEHALAAIGDATAVALAPLPLAVDDRPRLDALRIGAQ